MEGLIEGRIVHIVLGPEYGAHAGKHRAAIVCEVLNRENGEIYAHAFVSPSDLEQLPQTDPKTRVPYVHAIYSEAMEPYSWHWIEKAER